MGDLQEYDNEDADLLPSDDNQISIKSDQDDDPKIIHQKEQYDQIMNHSSDDDDGDDDNVDDPEFEPKIIDEQEKYNQILKKSINKVRILMMIVLAAPLLISTRHYVIFLYIQQLNTQFYDKQYEIITTLVFLGFILKSLTTLIIAKYSDKFGHDKSLLIALCFIFIGVFMESMAPNLLIFFIGYFVSRIAIQQIIMSYFAWILPHKYAISYMATSFTISSAIYLVGPLISGFIADFIDYSAVFWLNTGVLFLCILGVTLFKVVGSQKKLEVLQKGLSKEFINQQSNDDIFPICNTFKDIENDSEISEMNNSNNPWIWLKNEIGEYKAICLIVSITQNCLTWTIECIMMFYYALFMMEHFKNEQFSHIYSASMFFIITVCFGITMISFPKLIPRIIPKYCYIVSISSGLWIILMICIIIYNYNNNNPNVFIYWLITPILGILFGLMHITTEMSQLELQPKEHSGKIAGSKMATRILLRAFGTLLTGLFWKGPYHNSLWIANACCGLGIFILSFVNIKIAPYLNFPNVELTRDH